MWESSIETARREAQCRFNSSVHGCRPCSASVGRHHCLPLRQHVCDFNALLFHLYCVDRTASEAVDQTEQIKNEYLMTKVVINTDAYHRGCLEQQHQPAIAAAPSRSKATCRLPCFAKLCEHALIFALRHSKFLDTTQGQGVLSSDSSVALQFFFTFGD